MNSLYHCRQVSNIVWVKCILKVVPSPQMWLCRWHLVRILSFSTAVQVDQLSPLHPESHLKRFKIYIFVILIWFWVVIFLIIFLHNAVSIGYIYIHCILSTTDPPMSLAKSYLLPMSSTDSHWPPLNLTDPPLTITDPYWAPLTNDDP